MQSSEKGSVVLVGLVSVVLGLVVGLAVSAASKSPVQNSIPPAPVEIVVPRADTKAADFRVDTALLFQQHTQLVVKLMRQVFDAKNDVDPAVKKIMDDNADGVVKMITEYYGETRGREFGKAWKQHIGYFAQYAEAKKNKSRTDAEEVVVLLETFSDGMSAQLSSMNPNMSRDVLKVLMLEYVRSVEVAMDVYVKGEDVMSYQEEMKTSVKIGKIVDMLVNAIVKQNPEKF